MKEAWGPFDLLGRVTYQKLTGRLVSSSTQVVGQPTVATEYAYDVDAKITQLAIGGRVMATPSYTALQELASVTYRGGSQLASVSRDPAGPVTGQIWAFPSAAGITDQVTRSQSGRIVQCKPPAARPPWLATAPAQIFAGGRFAPGAACNW